MSRNGNILQVVENFLCTGCGTCVGICPERAVSMVEQIWGGLRPHVNEELCKDCGLCLKICPGRQVQREAISRVDPFVGEISAAYAAQVTDPELLANAQSGGVVTGLLLYALEVGYIDAAVVTSLSTDGSLRPELKLATSPEEIVNAQQSKYCPVALNTILPDIRESNKRVAIVGLPCHLHGLWNVGRVIPDFLQNVVMRIGLFCDRILAYGAIDSMIKGAGMAGQKIVDFKYRSKKWRGWPGDILIKSDQGEEVNLPLEVRFVIKDDFTPARCRLCYDKLNTFADIAVGDSYGLTCTPEGVSSILVRNENVHKLLLSAQKAAKVHLQEADPYRIVCGQAIEDKRKQFTLFSASWKRMGYTPPQYSLNYDYTKAPDTLDLKHYTRTLQLAFRFEKRTTAQIDAGSVGDNTHQAKDQTNTHGRYVPLISVQMITLNQQNYIAEAIESVLGQTYQNFELIIVDDGSTDNTREIVENFKSSKIKYFYKEHSGIGPSRNFAFKQCSGEYIAFLDSDDIYEPNILEVELATILGNCELVAVYTNLKIIDENGKKTGHIFQYRDYQPEELASALSKSGQNVIPFGSMMISKAVADKLVTFDLDLSDSFEMDYISRLTKYGRIKHIYLPLYTCRRHGSNVSDTLRLEKKGERTPIDVSELNKLGEMYFERKMWKEAETNFGKVLAVNARSMEAAYGFARTYINQGRKKEAIKALKKCVTIDPAFEQGVDLLKRLLLDFIASNRTDARVRDHYTFMHVAQEGEDLNFPEMTPAVITAFDIISRHDPEVSMLVYSRLKLQNYPWEIIEMVNDNTQMDFRELEEENIDLGRGSIFLYPAHSDFYEYKDTLTRTFSAAVPVITIASLGNGFVRSGYNGLLIQSEEVQQNGNKQCLINMNDLATKMHFLARDPDLVAEMARNALKTFIPSKED